MSSPTVFEGDEVDGFTVKFPSAVADTNEPYVRGTTVDVHMKLRVKAVNMVEDKEGKLVRQHVLVIESIKPLGSETPDVRRAREEARIQLERDLAGAPEGPIQEWP